MSSLDPDRITYFAETDYRNKRQRFGIKAKDRARHLYVIGKTGMGKSTLLDNMAIQDIQRGDGLAFMDPHGASADLLLDYIPEERIDDVLYFAPFDADYPISFNILEDVGYDKRHLVVSGLMSVFEKIWVDAWSARMAYILQNTLLALLEYPSATLLAVNRMYVDKNFRKEVVSHVSDPAVKSFWTEEFAGYTDRFAAEATPAIQNKIGQFVSNPIIRNIIGQSRTSFDFRDFMDNRKIVIVNLSKGQIGESNANLLGSMLVTKIYLAALSRADVSAQELNKLPSFNLFVDEFQSFANKSFADILSEARKYKLNLHIAHQYVEQMPEEVAAAVFGNVGTMITFRIGGSDSEIFEKEFAPQFTAEDMVNLGRFQMYLKLMVDSVSSAPFSAQTFPHIEKPKTSYRDMIIARSRNQFASPREQVEADILSWHESRSDNNAQKQQGNTQKDRGRRDKRRDGRGGANRDRGRDIGRGNVARTVPEKEARLRRAMSLDDLKEKPKKHKKSPSRENVNQLRDALEEALKDAGVGQKKQESSNLPRQETSQRQEAKPATEPPRQTVSTAQQSGEPKDRAQKQDSSKEQTGSKRSGEVPEHVLKKLLAMDESE